MRSLNIAYCSLHIFLFFLFLMVLKSKNCSKIKSTALCPMEHAICFVCVSMCIPCVCTVHALAKVETKLKLTLLSFVYALQCLPFGIVNTWYARHFIKISHIDSQFCVTKQRGSAEKVKHTMTRKKKKKKNRSFWLLASLLKHLLYISISVVLVNMHVVRKFV